ncbi:MAG: hypothetical protein DI539_00230 [Flavobacterium psychrophilum]|nr:MAG: hypothetical protein DI539_00230 [Flavobacterium psychrophilum]
MKKIISLLALFLSLGAFAQNFPGEKVELLKDKTLKVLPKAEDSQKYGFEDFYTDAALKNIYKKEGYVTPYNELVGKEFKLISYESLWVGPDNKYLRYKFLLENSETGQIYFKYDPEVSFKFPFEVVGGLEYPEGFFCEKIKKDGTATHYATPFEDGIQIVKNPGSQVLVVTINLPTTETSIPVAGWKGLTIVFDSGATISLPNEKLKASLNSYGEAVLTASPILQKPTDLKLLTQHKIKSVKLNKFEKVVNDGGILKEYFKCLQKL